MIIHFIINFESLEFSIYLLDVFPHVPWYLIVMMHVILLLGLGLLFTLKAWYLLYFTTLSLFSFDIAFFKLPPVNELESKILLRLISNNLIDWGRTNYKKGQGHRGITDHVLRSFNGPKIEASDVSEQLLFFLHSISFD